jgi:hypothetical protein
MIPMGMLGWRATGDGRKNCWTVSNTTRPPTPSAGFPFPGRIPGCLAGRVGNVRILSTGILIAMQSFNLSSHSFRMRDSPLNSTFRIHHLHQDQAHSQLSRRCVVGVLWLTYLIFHFFLDVSKKNLVQNQKFFIIFLTKFLNQLCEIVLIIIDCAQIKKGRLILIRC